MNVDMMAHGLGSSWRGTSETHQDNHSGGYILATVAYNMEILDLCCWLVGNCSVSYLMENGENTKEYMEMAPMKGGNHTDMADDFD